MSTTKSLSRVLKQVTRSLEYRQVLEIDSQCRHHRKNIARAVVGYHIIQYVYMYGSCCGIRAFESILRGNVYRY
jgi:hypothetical protein